MAAAGPLTYQEYSYLYRGDLYRLDLAPDSRASLATAAASIAPRNLRKPLATVDNAAHILFVCPRSAA